MSCHLYAELFTVLVFPEHLKTSWETNGGKPENRTSFPAFLKVCCTR